MTSRRLRGECPFDIDQLAAVAAFLGLPVAELVPEDVAA
jgi:hypothetical protein